MAFENPFNNAEKADPLDKKHRRQYRDMANNPEAIANHEQWEGIMDLWNDLMDRKKDRAWVRKEIIKFEHELKEDYPGKEGEETLKKYRVYDLMRGGTGSGEFLDLPNNEIQPPTEDRSVPNNRIQQFFKDTLKKWAEKQQEERGSEEQKEAA